MENLAGYAMEVSLGEVSMLRGEAGKSAYEIAVQNGYTGTEAEWLASLKGETGAAGADGKDGRDGTDGITPTIGSNGNWYLGGTDTGKPSRGADGATGATGATGENGADGKSAYQYAQEGGYTGTEAEFAEKLASGALIVTITDNNGTLSADKTYIEIRNAIFAGIPVLVDYGGSGLPLIGATVDNLLFGIIMCDETSVATVIIEITSNNEVNDISASVETLPNPNALTFTGAVTGTYDGSAAVAVNIPTALKNPNALTFTGAVSGSYDGSSAKTINIPSAVTDAHINSLIDTKLGVIENGSY